MLKTLFIYYLSFFPDLGCSVFKHCPFLVRESTARGIDKLIAQWKTHKYSKPLRGGIILNQDLTKVRLFWAEGIILFRRML